MEKSLPESDLNSITEILKKNWIERRGERILITGGTGFVGSWILESVLHANSQLKLCVGITAITRNASLLASRYAEHVKNNTLDIVEGDLASVEFPSGSYSHVIHLATGAPSGSSGLSDGFFIHDQLCSHRLAEFCVSAGASKVLFTSSGAVYGRVNVPKTGIAETIGPTPDLREPGSGYGLGKLCSEYIFNSLGALSGVTVTNARLFAFVGPRLPLTAGYAIGNFINDAINGRRLTIGSDGKPKRSYLYASDLAIWLWTMLFLSEKTDVFNVGGCRILSIGELAATVVSALGSDCDVVVLGVPSAVPSKDYFPDVSKARKTFGLGELVGLEAGIIKTANWYRGGIL